MERQRKQPKLLKDKDYRSEVGVEPRGKTGERSFSKAETEGRDELNEQGKLLEAILSRDNMNLAYKRVKENAGSAGIDGMKTHELLPYLKEHGAKLDAASKAAVEASIEKVKAAEKGDDIAAINSAVDGLQQASYALSQHMQAAAGAPGAEASSSAEASSTGGKPDEEVIDAEFEKKS